MWNIFYCFFNKEFPFYGNIQSLFSLKFFLFIFKKIFKLVNSIFNSSRLSIFFHIPKKDQLFIESISSILVLFHHVVLVPCATHWNYIFFCFAIHTYLLRINRPVPLFFYYYFTMYHVHTSERTTFFHCTWLQILLLFNRCCLLFCPFNPIGWNRSNNKRVDIIIFFIIYFK